MIENIKRHYGGDDATDVSSYGWNFIMATFQCCGVDNHTDMHRAKNWDRRMFLNGYQYLKEIPLACCQHEIDVLANKKFGALTDKNCTIRPTERNSHIDRPCWPSIQH